MNILISDWWDRSPCVWICDLNKLDTSCPVQRAYKAKVLDALSKSEHGKTEHLTADEQEVKIDWYYQGTATVEDDADSPLEEAGRPEEVCHAAVMPPCQIDGYVTIYYGDL